MFSPYYAWDRARRDTQPDNYCALNVALYSRHAKRWTMTERGARLCHRDDKQFTIGPSQLRWDGNALVLLGGLHAKTKGLGSLGSKRF